MTPFYDVNLNFTDEIMLENVFPISNKIHTDNS